MRRARVVLIVLVLAALGAGAAVALAGGSDSGSSGGGGSRTGTAYASSGSTTVSAGTVTTPASQQCVTQGPPPPALSSARPPSRVLSAFGVLRRAGRPGDRLPRGVRDRLSGDLSRIDVRYVRLLARHGSAHAYLIPGSGSLEPFPPYRCARQHESRARYDQQHRAYERRNAQARRTSVLCVAADRGGVTEFGCTPSKLVLAGAQVQTSDRGGPPATVTTLVPDRVGLVVPVYRHQARVVVPLYARHSGCLALPHHNIASYRVNRPAPTAAPHNLLWYDRQGRPLKKINTHGAYTKHQPRCGPVFYLPARAAGQRPPG